MGRAGRGLSGRIGPDTRLAVELKPAFPVGVPGRDDGVPNRLALLPFSPGLLPNPLMAEGGGNGGVGVGKDFSVFAPEEKMLSLRASIFLIRSFAVRGCGGGAAGWGLAALAARATDFSLITVSSIELGVPTFFSIENFWCRYRASASILKKNKSKDYRSAASVSRVRGPNKKSVKRTYPWPPDSATQ